jgi:hypothetical protein
MREVVCSHCGAVFFSEAEVPVCPHCGRNPHGMSWRRMGTLGTENFGIAFWILWIALVFQPWHADWGTIAVASALAVAAGASILYFRKSPRGAKGPVTTLNLTEPARAFSGPWTEPKPPSVPSRWSSLMSLTRPREVFWPWRRRLLKLVDIAFVLGSAGYIGVTIHGQRIAFAGRTAVTPKDWFTFVTTAVADVVVIFGAWREIENHRFLRDGEATIGRIVDWIHNRHSLRIVVYQFWTRSGERFQHQGAIRSNKDDYSDLGPVPVFYFPEDPSRSVALCCTTLQVRNPSEEFAARAQRLGMKS